MSFTQLSSDGQYRYTFVDEHREMIQALDQKFWPNVALKVERAIQDQELQLQAVATVLNDVYNERLSGCPHLHVSGQAILAALENIQSVAAQLKGAKGIAKVEQARAEQDRERHEQLKGGVPAQQNLQPTHFINNLTERQVDQWNYWTEVKHGNKQYIRKYVGAICRTCGDRGVVTVAKPVFVLAFLRKHAGHPTWLVYSDVERIDWSGVGRHLSN